MSFSRKSILSLTIGVFLGIVSAGVYWSVNPLSAKSGASSKTDGLSMHGSIHKIYASTDEFVQDSDVIVVGKFSNKPTLKRPTKLADLPTANSEDQLPPPRNQDLLLQRDPGHRDLSFMVRRVLKGDSTTKQVVVAQRGAIGDDTTENTVKPVEGDTLFKPGGQYILFLKKAFPHEIQNAGYEFYWIVGASQGAHRLVNGKVYSRNIQKKAINNEAAIDTEIPEDLGQKVDGIEEEKFIQDIESKVK
jgi:hypothetical protein